jgi:hypothetical protein
MLSAAHIAPDNFAELSQSPLSHAPRNQQLSTQ